MNYLYPKQVIFLYQKIIEVSGGSYGLRDKGLLESAVYRPQTTFGGHDLYPDIPTKAAALIHSLIKNHPFVDGNKRVGFESMRLFLRINHFDINASIKDNLDVVLDIANDRLTEDKVAHWINGKLRPYKG